MRRQRNAAAAAITRISLSRSRRRGVFDFVVVVFVRPPHAFAASRWAGTEERSGRRRRFAAYLMNRRRGVFPIVDGSGATWNVRSGSGRRIAGAARSDAGDVCPDVDELVPHSSIHLDPLHSLVSPICSQNLSQDEKEKKIIRN